MRESLSHMTLKQLFATYPYAMDFFSSLPGLQQGEECLIEEYFTSLADDILQDM